MIVNAANKQVVYDEEGRRVCDVEDMGGGVVMIGVAGMGIPMEVEHVKGLVTAIELVMATMIGHGYEEPRNLN